MLDERKEEGEGRCPERSDSTREGCTKSQIGEDGRIGIPMTTKKRRE